MVYQAVRSTTVEALEKSQRLRVIDVTVLGPFMIWAGLQTRLPSWARTAMLAAGGMTIAYNLRNYQANLTAGPRDATID